MKRKIIKQGSNTLTVTLPSEWVNEFNIKPGDEVDIDACGSSLIINGNHKKGFRSTTINIDNLPMPMLWRFFQAAYREGYNEIKLVFSDRKLVKDAFNFYSSQNDYSRLGVSKKETPPVKMIEKIVNRFVGIEVIETGKGYCIIREMGETNDKEFSSSVNRVFILLADLFNKVIDDIKNDRIGDVSTCEDIHSMDNNIDRFIDFCCRMNNQKLDNSQSDKVLMYSTLYFLELLGDQFKAIGFHLSKSKMPVSGALPYAKIVKDHFDLYCDLFLNYSTQKAITFGLNDYKVYTQHFNWKALKNPHQESIMKHLMIISKYCMCLMEFRVEMEYNKNQGESAKIKQTEKIKVENP